MPLTRSNRGFTLIELLVVVGIISMLASIVLVAVKGAREKSKDGVVMLSIRQIQTALELYRDRNGFYPGMSGFGTDVFDIGGSTDFTATLNPLVTDGFISRVIDHPDWPDNLDYTTKGWFEYETDSALYPGTNDPFSCGTNVKPFGGYVLLIGSPRQLNLPHFGHLWPNGSITDEVTTFTAPAYYYCVVSPRGA